MELFSEYLEYDALGLAGLVRKKEVTPAELCHTAMERIRALNPGINAVVTDLSEKGMEAAAGNPPGPFYGVPFLVKDLGYDIAGVPTTNGCQGLRNARARQDSEMVARYKKAGLVILGKTSTPEFGLMGITEPDLFGPCRNPWDPDRTPGGSSGGAGASVAAGFVPMSAGGDGGGSIRIPSSYCGLFGLKPSRGRNPAGPKQGQPWRGAVQEHVLTRSVRDSAAALDATQGPDAGAPFEIRPPAKSYLDEVGADPGKLKIAFNTLSPIGTPVHPDYVRAVKETAALLEELGHHVEEAAPDIDGMALAESYITMYFGEVAVSVRQVEEQLGRKLRPGDVEPSSLFLARMGEVYSAFDMTRAMHVWDGAARSMGRFFSGYDLYLTPTNARPPSRIGELKPHGAEAFLLKAVNRLHAARLIKPLGIVEKMARESLTATPFTQLANLTGLPAASVPLWEDTEGLPLGVQLVASFGREDLLFRLGSQLEQARPWFGRMPHMAKSA